MASKVTKKSEKKIVDITSLVMEYDQLKEREKAIKKRKDEVAKFIKDYTMKNGVKDQNGSYYLQDENFIYGSQARTSVSLDVEKAKDFFKAQGLYEEVIDLVEVLNEDKIEQLVINETISIEDVESITVSKTTMAIDVKAKEKEKIEEEMPTIETKKVVKKLPNKK